MSLSPYYQDEAVTSESGSAAARVPNDVPIGHSPCPEYSVSGLAYSPPR